MMAVKDENKFRVFQKRSEGLYVCIDCKEAIEDLRPSPLPFLQQKGDRFMLNQGVHFAGCRLRELSELMARDIDRCAREEIEHNPLMKPQDNINKHLHDESMLPDTLNFLSAASHLLANVEKKEQKAAAKRKSLIQLKKMRRVCKRFSVCENSDAVKQISVPVINPAKRNVRTPLAEECEISLLRYKMNHFDVVINNI
uniref:Uncharacterized protein n=1 Tax=Ditylenchus dipsaci TaxID=166011 RepID=A0A915DQZ2_9BILA